MFGLCIFFVIFNKYIFILFLFYIFMGGEWEIKNNSCNFFIFFICILAKFQNFTKALCPLVN
jgi:hypothetical protein